MVIVMRSGASQKEIDAVAARVKEEGFGTHLVQGTERTIVCVLGDGRPVDQRKYDVMAGVEKTTRILKPFKLTSRSMSAGDSTLRLNGTTVGTKPVVIMAGPCSVESRTQLLETAHAVKEAGAQVLRGGAFKPRTSPYSFQGLGEEGLQIMAEARDQTGLPVVTEVMASEQVPLVMKYADMLQVGTRNMQNYELLRAVGRSGHPVLLKRGLMSTIEELLMSAEYILAEGNRRVLLCERGIRTFEKYTRNTTDINAIPVLKDLTHLPVILDPSHGVGKWAYVAAVARAGVAAGADGLLV
ncbi:MAG TPA: 3-deoxy-7-phosphoheptulonate synthase, partial [Anaerolineales bacterium]|nr:3-deoxy-7-phosphoheptulonate synthase [Anaerolineales bacterium]